MPFIRDFASAYESSTAEGGITIPICNYQQNDLLLVFAEGDTGAGTWGCSGYTQLYARNATSSFICYYKIAGASESDVVVTNTIAETYNGCVIAIGDVDTTYPFGNPAQFTETTGSGTRFTMPQVTTQRNNSLIIYHAGSSGNNAGIHFVEGPLHELLISDGAAEGQGVGWMLQAASGVSSASIYCDSPVSTVVKAAICINPPSGGATVIPPYCVSDASQYLDPNSAAVNFDSNTYMAATADTNFGTSIASKTCNDATVAIAADIGVNSFHGMQGLTNAVTAGQISGACLVLAAARYNVGTRNVLAHFRHPTPANNQRLSNIGSGRGVWMGLRSGATAAQNWKVWQVHGSDVPIVAGNIQPLVVNCGNTDTIATNGTLVNSDVRYVGFWTGGLGILTQQTCIGPIWALDTVVLAGGSTGNPLGITEIVDVAARAKERLSSIQQGAKQMLCLQLIQFGDGGTNLVDINLDSTAIEFPSRKNAANKVVNYNGIDNSVGFIYYPGPQDSIIHKNSIISSANKFRWGLHASASTSASYDFSGLVIIGAGTVTLKSGITFDGITFQSCDEIAAIGATIVNCSFKSTTGAGALNIATSAEMDEVTNTTFSGNAYGIRLTSVSAAMYAFTGIQFSGNTKDIYVAATSGTVTINVTSGDTPTYDSAGATVVINNPKTLTLTGLIANSEVRIYTHGTITELAGIENSGTSFEYQYNYSAGTYVDIVIHKPEYLYYRIDNYLLANGDASIPISQQFDRQYANP